MSEAEDEDYGQWEEVDNEGKPLEPEPVPLTELEKIEQKRRKLQEEIELLGREEAELLEARRRKVKALKDDPVVWSCVADVDGRNDARRQVGIDSPAAKVFGIERNSLLAEFRRSWYQRVEWLMSPRGGGLSGEEAAEEVNRGHTKEAQEDEQGALALYRALLQREKEGISWHSLSELFGRAPDLAEDIWLRMKREAREEFESGHYIAKLFEENPDFNTPAQRSEVLAIRESMHEQWKPLGGVEVSMVDTMTISYFLMIHWTRKAIKMSTTDPRRESYDYQQWRRSHPYDYEYRDQRKYRRLREPQWTKGHWDTPFIEEAEAIEQAHQLADRWRRAFHASSRALRDWRRYNVPVTINNPRQVNIAADGGQQVNVQSKHRGSQKATGKKRAGRRALRATSGERVNLGKARKVKARAE